MSKPCSVVSLSANPAAKNHFLTAVQPLIDRAEIVSFDIFDTLLLRPYLAPTDLFVHLERSAGKPLFAENRIRAEIAAREKLAPQEDITLADIYAAMPPEFVAMQSQELAWERRVLRANPETAAAFAYARDTGKRVIIVSDMYLPPDFVAEILAQNGFAGYEKLYLSSTVQKTKATGNLYRFIAAELSIDPAKILHLGDNEKSDYQNAKNAGWQAARYRTPVEKFFASDARAQKFWRDSNGDDGIVISPHLAAQALAYRDGGRRGAVGKFLRKFRREALIRRQLNAEVGASIMLTLLAWRRQKIALGWLAPDYEEQLGYEYAGPLAYGYCRFIAAQAAAEHLDELLFVARDGYTLQKVFALLRPATPTRYVYAPRYLNAVCRLDYVWREQAQIIIDHFRDRDAALQKIVAATDFSRTPPPDFIQQHLDLFRRLADAEMADYRRYLRETTAARVGAVDANTTAFSSQKLIVSALAGQAVVGFYWGVQQAFSLHGAFAHRCFAGHSPLRDEKIFTANWDFVELLFAAPELPVESLTPDGEPVYQKNVSPHEKKRVEISGRISTGAVDFAHDLHVLLGDVAPLTAPLLVRWVNCFCEMPAPLDRQKMTAIWHARDSGHRVYQPLFVGKIAWRDYWCRPLRSLQLCREFCWRSVGQTLLMSVAMPVKIRWRGVRRFAVSLFPCWRRRYLTVTLRISPTTEWRFMVGNENE
ncbi:hypothetical protein AGMMS49959_17150 [Planctomycetales bacterium]|nr:hypothetical protein AGMMS49959_17150 [Planctomycetales bacterium]